MIIALFDLFDIKKFSLNGIELLFTLWIRLGWLGSADDEYDDPIAFLWLIESLHECARHPKREALLRIIRQLYALGLCRDMEFPLRNCIVCLFQSGFQKSKCLDAMALSLRKEFIQNPPSLLQLARMAIRRRLGMNDFERRVKTLPLPPLLLKYVWLANEKLAD